MSPTLGLAESIERLDAMPEFLEAAIDAAGQAQNLLFQPAPGEFSLVEHACHLRDVDREAFLVRVRRMAAENAPALQPFDGGAIAAARDYRRQDARIAAQEFAAARRELVGMLAPLTGEDMARAGTFGGAPVSFADVIAMMVEHDRVHREEIEHLIDRLEER